MSHHTQESVGAEVLTALKSLGYAPESLEALDWDREDLGLPDLPSHFDSLSTIEFAITLEEQTNWELSPAGLSEVKSTSDLVRLILNQLTK